MTRYNLECWQNAYLPVGAGVMDAVLRVTVEGAEQPPVAGTPDSSRRAEVIMLDCSGSMEGAKLKDAKEATAAAIDCLPDGTEFAIIAGNHEAHVVFPDGPPMAVASAQTRESAKSALKRLQAAGGTAIGQWIELTAQMLSSKPGFRHAILLTDGKNEHEEPADFERRAKAAEGVFQCDCRGVGKDWVPQELQMVASVLLGTCQLIRDPSELAEQFSLMMGDALSKVVPDVAIRIWCPKRSGVTMLKQMDPEIDLTAARVELDERAGDYPTGAWGTESREYHLRLSVQPGSVDEQVTAARVVLVVEGDPVDEQKVQVIWTDDESLSTVMHPKVDQVVGDNEVSDLMRQGAQAYRDGDEDLATEMVNRAARRAKEVGNEEVLARLLAFADEDPSTGMYRLKDKVNPLDLMQAEVDGSTRMTINKNRRRCPNGHATTGLDICDLCHAPMDTSAQRDR